MMEVRVKLSSSVLKCSRCHQHKYMSCFPKRIGKPRATHCVQCHGGIEIMPDYEQQQSGVFLR
jgi:hypothetical protein